MGNFTRQEGIGNLLMKRISYFPKSLRLAALMLVMALIAAACGSQPTATAEPEAAPTEVEAEAPTAEPETAPTEEEVQAEAVPAQPDVLADTLPCEVAIIDSDETTLSIRFREPTDDQSLMIGAVRPSMALRIDQMQDREGATWYRTINPGTNTPFGWVEARYIVLSEDCVSGDGGGGNAAETATEESD